MTGYSSGLRRMMIEVLNRKEQTVGRFGIDSAGVEWESEGWLHADVTWAKGKQAMNAGALDVYGVILVRMNWTDAVNMRSRIVWRGQTYQILAESFHDDFHDNTIQFHAQLIINDKRTTVKNNETEASSNSAL